MTHENPSQGLPLNDQTFAEIIEQNLLYVDKTKYIYKMVTSSDNIIMLWRPSHFGKTLLLKTLKELFSGNSQLFKDLWIGQSDYEFPKYPVIFLNLDMESSSPEKTRHSLIEAVKKAASEHNLSVKSDWPAKALEHLIIELQKKYDSKVVLLVDDYDGSVLKNIDNQKLAMENADEITSILACLKEPDVTQALRFTLITGVTPYGLNSSEAESKDLRNITFSSEYAALCGFTVEEFDSTFTDWLPEVLANFKNKEQVRSSFNLDDLRETIISLYGGYNFNPGDFNNKILCPSAILEMCSCKLLYYYWYVSFKLDCLGPLILSKPEYFFWPRLRANSMKDLLERDLSRASTEAFLFYNGFFTLMGTGRKLEEKYKDNDLSSYCPIIYFPNKNVSHRYYKLIFGANFHYIFGISELCEFFISSIEGR
ncbi:MAG: AAA family ATPase, partial [Deltaproteobacteria bacterium]|nr:AAA family ATPase [Deltaproteobacteria bacterium]